MKAPRPGSRKADVYQFFRSHGYEETVQYGRTLDLAESTIRSWINNWKDAAPLETHSKSDGSISLICVCGKSLTLIDVRTCPDCGAEYRR